MFERWPVIRHPPGRQHTAFGAGTSRELLRPMKSARALITLIGSPSMSDPSYVPVDADALSSLEDAAIDLGGAKVALDRATQALLELAEDLSREAGRRIEERGGSEAQVDRVESSFRSCAGEVQAKSKALDVACTRLREALRTTRL
jgi:hypothetical protein